MEPTLDCAKPAPGCLGKADDRVVVQVGGSVKEGDIAVFRTPMEAAVECGTSGLFVKRVIGLPGETVREDDHGFIWVRGPNSKTFVKLEEPYLSAQRRLEDSMHFGQTWHVPKGGYFMMGDNRAASCDSRTWGSVPRRNIIGPVVQIIRSGPNASRSLDATRLAAADVMP
jgi:signal peptidase I